MRVGPRTIQSHCSALHCVASHRTRIALATHDIALRIAMLADQEIKGRFVVLSAYTRKYFVSFPAGAQKRQKRDK